MQFLVFPCVAPVAFLLLLANMLLLAFPDVACEPPVASSPSVAGVPAVAGINAADSVPVFVVIHAYAGGTGVYRCYFCCRSYCY
jgi:hypothetical protein